MDINNNSSSIRRKGVSLRMINKVVTLSLDDIDFIRDNIPNFSGFVRSCVRDYKIIVSKGVSEERDVLKQMEELANNADIEMSILKNKLKSMQDIKEKEAAVRVMPEVIECVKRLKSGKGNIEAMATRLTNQTGMSISSALLMKWVNES